MTTRKPVFKSNSMKRSSTYIPSGDINKTSLTIHQSPQRSMTLSHRRSQSATFLPRMMSQQLSSKNCQIVESSSKPDFPKSKRTIFDTEVKHYFFAKTFFSSNFSNFLCHHILYANLVTWLSCVYKARMFKTCWISAYFQFLHKCAKTSFLNNFLTKF